MEPPSPQARRRHPEQTAGKSSVKKSARCYPLIRHATLSIVLGTVLNPVHYSAGKPDTHKKKHFLTRKILRQKLEKC